MVGGTVRAERAAMFRPFLFAFAALSIVACSGGSDEDDNAIQVSSAAISCDKQKTDVLENLRAACDGKTSCTCDEACWTKGGFPAGCTDVSFSIGYKAAGTLHAHASGGLKAGRVFTITEDGKARFQ